MHTFFRYFTFRALTLLAFASWIAAVSIQAFQEPSASAQKSLSDGVYSAAQAERGQKTFEGPCAACHETSQFTGNEFFKSWAGKTLQDLFEQVKATMPEDNPGSLEPQQYVDVIAYFLKLNKFPAGETELKVDDEVMKAVKFEKKSG